MGRNSLPQKGGAALWHVTVEAFFYPLIRHSLMQGFDHGVAQGQGNVPDAHPVQLCVWVGFQIGLDFLGNIIKQVRVL